MSTERPLGGEAHGFTLLEIAVVIFIMGLMLTLITPYAGGFRSARLKREVRRLAGRASFLYGEASARKLVMRLTFDLDANRYLVFRLDPYSPQPLFVPDLEPGSAPVTLPDGVRMRDVTVEGIGTVQRGTVSCQFYPEGYVDATVVHMQNQTGTVYTLTLQPLTGRVKIEQGDVAPAAAALAGVPQ